MLDEKDFALAVTMATAFVSNGDLRLEGTTRKGSQTLSMIEDLIPELYFVLRSARKNIEQSPGS